jgi:AraC-like DNA-binding protein/DNA gyrase inhibitor GyrI
MDFLHFILFLDDHSHYDKFRDYYMEVYALKEDHIHKIEQAKVYIHTHLGHVLSLSEVAEAVSYSPFHFHRLFKQHAGETLHSYVKRVRIETATCYLVSHSDISITEIAGKFGFSTLANFCRAFQQWHGVSPSQYRHRTEAAIGSSSPGLPVEPATDAGAFHIEARFLPAQSVVYQTIRSRGGSFDSMISQAFGHVSATYHECCPDESQGQPILASADENWLQPRHKLTYDACIAVPASTNKLKVHHTAMKGLHMKNLPGGLYAVHRLEKQHATIPLAFAEAIREMNWISEYIYMHWIPDHGFTLDHRPGLNIFYSEPTQTTIIMECCLPIAPISSRNNSKN